MAAVSLPPYAVVDRSRPLGLHPFTDLLPRVWESPALARMEPDTVARARLVETARVRVSAVPGYAYIEVDTPCVNLAWSYYKLGRGLDLYLDLLHELTHLRQLAGGADLWDKRFPYVDRWTEVEGYAVAVEEGLRLGMTVEDVRDHLSNPWMTRADVAKLETNIRAFLATHPRQAA
jgi:hypothetical protein